MPTLDPTLMKELCFAGPFAMGSVFGGLLSSWLFNIASQERRDRVRYEMERERELQKQIEIKEQRIAALHSLMGQQRLQLP